MENINNPEVIPSGNIVEKKATNEENKNFGVISPKPKRTQTLDAFFTRTPVKKRKVSEDMESPAKKLQSLNDTEPEPTSEAKLAVEKTTGTTQSTLAPVVTGPVDPLFALEYESMDPTWLQALKAEFTKPYFKQLKTFLEAEQKGSKIFPPAEDIYSWSRFTPLSKVKVVILGQDPYHGTGQAHGLAFSVKKGVGAPPSLVNIYKTLQQDIPGFTPPNHGYLAGWAKQGVLMLNAALTVRAHQANSHAGKGWEEFTDAVIQYLNQNKEGLVFMLWGSYAQKKGKGINQKKHLVLKSVHPSPLSAHRGFFSCQHFSKANKYLKDHSKKPIAWETFDE
ncbi:uracil DNA glycosylase [Basidiobolus ranarum]|uniref:Uracil-DNA glycosylase n=1 Tax=Basidiobolus ranarum TaxID=34480 RepID=A0ABR2VZP3_9FUNG